MQPVPDSAGSLGDVGVVSAVAMHFQILVGTVTKDLRAVRREVSQPGDILSGRQSRCLMQMDRGHTCSFHSVVSRFPVSNLDAKLNAVLLKDPPPTDPGSFLRLSSGSHVSSQPAFVSG